MFFFGLFHSFFVSFRLCLYWVHRMCLHGDRPSKSRSCYYWEIKILVSNSHISLVRLKWSPFYCVCMFIGIVWLHYHCCLMLIFIDFIWEDICCWRWDSISRGLENLVSLTHQRHIGWNRYLSFLHHFHCLFMGLRISSLKKTGYIDGIRHFGQSTRCLCSWDSDSG